jgi:hypothetical protein
MLFHGSKAQYAFPGRPLAMSGLNQAVQERLGGSGCVGEWRPKRPKGMHRRTFWRLTQVRNHTE